MQFNLNAKELRQWPGRVVRKQNKLGILWLMLRKIGRSLSSLCSSAERVDEEREKNNEKKPKCAWIEWLPFAERTERGRNGHCVCVYLSVPVFWHHTMVINEHYCHSSRVVPLRTSVKNMSDYGEILPCSGKGGGMARRPSAWSNSIWPMETWESRY